MRNSPNGNQGLWLWYIRRWLTSRNDHEFGSHSSRSSGRLFRNSQGRASYYPQTPKSHWSFPRTRTRRQPIRYFDRGYGQLRVYFLSYSHWYYAQSLETLLTPDLHRGIFKTLCHKAATYQYGYLYGTKSRRIPLKRLLYSGTLY